MTTDATNSSHPSQNGADRRRRAKRGEPSEPNELNETNETSDQAEREAEQPFEAQLEELDRIVNALEEGRLPLEESLTLYERGMRLAKACQDRLDAAELRVRRLRVLPAPTEDDGLAFTLEDFEPDE